MGGGGFADSSVGKKGRGVVVSKQVDGGAIPDQEAPGTAIVKMFLNLLCVPQPSSHILPLSFSMSIVTPATAITTEPSPRGGKTKATAASSSPTQVLTTAIVTPMP